MLTRRDQNLIFSNPNHLPFHSYLNQDLSDEIYKFLLSNMSKAIVLVLALVACAIATPGFEQIKSIVDRDECGIHGMETVRPQIQNKVEELKMVKFKIYSEPRQC